MEFYVADGPLPYLVVLLMFGVFLTLFSRAWLLSEMSRKVRGLSFFFCLTPFYLEAIYLRRRSEIGSRRLDLGFLVANAAIVGLVPIGVALWRTLQNQ